MASLLFLVPLVLLWVLFVRPQQRRMRQAQAMVATLGVGDEIITSGGIYGTVTDADDTSLWLEVAPDVVIRILRAAVAQRVPTDLDALVDHDDDADDDDDTVVDADDTGVYDNDTGVYDNDNDDDDNNDDGDVHHGAIQAPGSNGLSAGVPNTATEKTSGDDEA